MYVVETKQEFEAFFRLSHLLMPNLGFDKAGEIARGLDFVVKDDTPELIRIAAPSLRAIRHLGAYVNSFEPPTHEWFRSLS